MAADDGGKYRLYISSDGTSDGTKAVLDCNDTLQYNSGKGIGQAVARGCTHPFETNSGASVTGDFLPEVPLSTTQQQLWDASDDGTVLYVWLENQTTGAVTIHGEARAAVTQFDPARESAAPVQFTLGFVGAPTRGAYSSS